VILLLVSPDFLASTYCYEIEMKRALQRHTAGEARVIPIILRRCDWSRTPFASLQALPQDARPITEWENRDTAWNNVTKHLRRVIESLSPLERSAARTALPEVWNVPYPQNPFFIGRDEQLARLHTQLQADRATALSQPQAVSGLGGIGKTQLAVEYAYRYQQEYKVVLWARAENKDTLISSYSTIAEMLKLPERKAQEQDITIQAVLRDGIDVEGEKLWKRRVVMAVNEACPDVIDVREWDACELWVPHAQMCAVWIEQEQIVSLEAAHLLNASGYYLSERARYGVALPLYERALGIREKQLGAEHPDTAGSLNNMAALYERQGNYAEALPLYERALGIFERQLGRDHPSTQIVRGNYAGLLREMGRDEDARRVEGS
jgi:tetratricopeptide (TPR) repeat protein